MTDVHPASRLLQEGKMIGLDLREHMGLVMFLPTKIHERAAERGPGRIGTLPSLPKPKPAHGGYPDYQSVSFPERVRNARRSMDDLPLTGSRATEIMAASPAPKKISPFSIVRN